MAEEDLSVVAQEIALQKNRFYRDNYRRTLAWLMRLLFLCAVLSVLLAWSIMERKQPKYYAAVTSGQVIPLHSLSEPVITNSFITQWSARTARILFNLNFSRYQDQISRAQPRFTPSAWVKMQSVLQNAFINNIVSNKLIVSSVVSGRPVVLSRMIIHGRYTWRVQMKMLMKFTSASAETQETLIVTMNVQRVPTLNSSQGVQITQFAAAPG